jgi:hypothetical protein
VLYPVEGPDIVLIIGTGLYFFFFCHLRIINRKGREERKGFGPNRF